MFRQLISFLLVNNAGQSSLTSIVPNTILVIIIGILGYLSSLELELDCLVLKVLLF